MKSGTKESSKSMELKKHVAVIHSSGRVSLLQRKIANALLFHAYNNLLTKEDHSIHVSVLTSLIGYDSHDHKRVKQALINLLATVIEWNIVDGERIDKEGTWNASSLIADASINGAICTYSYSNKMRKLLYHPSVYGRVSLEVQAKFQSSYGLALYENCNRYQDIGQTPLFDLDKFRKLMGVDENKYKIFRDFKTRVLDKAVEEVNKYSPLTVEPILKKQNRQVISVQFLISHNKVEQSQTNDIPKNKTVLIDKLRKQFGLSQKQILILTEKYDDSYIDEKMRIIESSESYLSGKIKNLAKYLLCAVEENFQSVKTSKVKSKIYEPTTKIEEHRAEYEKYKKDVLLEQFSKLDLQDQEVFTSKFEKFISKTLYENVYREKN